jgi:phage repressor protein C with HTH and peptisase S24 domain
MTTKDRLKEFLSSQKIGRNRFEEQLGISIGYMSSKATTITSDVIEKTISAYPILNIEWLLTGKGEMFKSKIEASTPIDSDKSVSYRLVPLLNLDAVGGMHSLNLVSENPEYTEKLIPFTDAQDGDVALVVSGNSMDPTCPSGSKVLIREVENWKEYFGFGNIFVLLLTDGRRILKEVQKYPEDSKNYVLCKSHNEKYPEEELPKSMIKSVWKVVKILNERGW